MSQPTYVIVFSKEGCHARAEWPDGRVAQIEFDDAMEELKRMAALAKTRRTQPQTSGDR